MSVGTSEKVPGTGLQVHSPEMPHQVTVAVISPVQHPNQTALGLPSMVRVTLNNQYQLSMIRGDAQWQRF